MPELLDRMHDAWQNASWKYQRLYWAIGQQRVDAQRIRNRTGQRVMYQLL